MYKSRFIITNHFADRAGFHHDLRFRKPNTNKRWDSFATRKDIPMVSGKKVMLVRTTIHKEKEALYVGVIEKGYGKGRIETFDEGDCNIIKYEFNHIVIEFFGKKIKGIYHFLNTGVIDREYDKEQYLFFKAKEKYKEKLK
jgi:bifunctional non-homologous end joining protein LigD